MKKSILVEWMKTMFRTIVPVTVVSYDSSNNTATVKPTMTDIDNLENPISGSNTIEIEQTPVFMYGDSNNNITFPLSAGSNGVLLCSDRDIDNLVSNQGSSSQVASRIGSSLKDGFFLSGLFLQGSNDGLKISSTTKITLSVGSNSIVIDSDSITIGGVNFTDHVHTGVSTGTDNTGPVFT